MKFGLADDVVQRIQQVLLRFPAVSAAIIYGSRAKGNYKPSSDIDLTLKGENVDLATLTRIANELDDLLLPQKFDVSIYEHISNRDLLDHIDRVGQLLR